MFSREMCELLDDLKNIRLAIFDLDGVVYRGNTLIPNADKVINKLKDLSIKVVYNSNNSTATRKTYVERLKNLNIKSEITDFYTSASITSAEITKIKEKANIYVIGEIGLRQELKSLGHNVETNPTDYKDIVPPEQTCIFGDRLNTDILAGNRAGIISVAVLTGVTTRDMIENIKEKAMKSKNFDNNLIPDLVIEKLADIFKN